MKLKYAILFLGLLIAGRAQAQRTFYISYSSGSNSNAGTSQASPWKTHPYMPSGASCTGSGSAPAYTHQAGDQFIFKGGDTWPSACFPINVGASGTSSAHDYYGVCANAIYFFPSPSDPLNPAPVQNPCAGGTGWPATGWTRPLFDANDAEIGSFFNITSRTNLTIDNIEMAHQGIAKCPSFCSNGNSILGNATRGGNLWNVGVLVENVYIHDWQLGDATTSWTSGTNNGFSLGGIQGVQYVMNSELSDENGAIWSGGVRHTNTCTDSGSDSCGGNGVYDAQVVAGDKIHAGWLDVTGVADTHDDDFYHIYQNGPAGSLHTQMIETEAPCSSGIPIKETIYNVHLHDSTPGAVLLIPPTSTVVNNVFGPNLLNNRPVGFCTFQNTSASDVGYVLNNTFDTTGATVRVYTQNSGPSSNLGTLYIQNNLQVNTASSGAGSFQIEQDIPTATTHIGNNFGISSADATTFGYTTANLYAPSSGGPDTGIVNAGANETSFCGGVIVATLCKDAQGAPWFNGSAATRPTGTTPWTIGAFVYPAGASGGPNPPPSVSVTAPGPGNPASFPNITGTITMTATCTPGGTATVSSIQFQIDGITFGAAGTSSTYNLSLNTTQMANGSHTIGAVCTQSDTQSGSASPVAVTVSNALGTCFNSDPVIQSQSFTPQTGTGSATFTAEAFTSNEDAMVTVDMAVPGTYTGGTINIHFRPDGKVSVLGGSVTDTYVGGEIHSFTLTYNVQSGIYSLVQTSPRNVTLASNQAFANPDTSLNVITAQSINIVPNTAQVCAFTLGSQTVAFSPNPLHFGSVPLGSSGSGSVTVTVSGSVTFSGTTITGANAADFSITSNGCTGAVSTSCVAVLSFAPKAPGLRVATLNFTDTAAGSPQSINIDGTGLVARPPCAAQGGMCSF